MRIRVVAFAALRERLGTSVVDCELAEGARVRDAWDALARGREGMEALAASTRIARNGKVASFDDAVADGDELALLPPVGGG